MTATVKDMLEEANRIVPKVTAEEARALCVVSALKLESGDELSASCARAEGHRCARSWRVFPDAEFGHVAGHPTLSDRDGAVVVALAERGLIKD